MTILYKVVTFQKWKDLYILTKNSCDDTVSREDQRQPPCRFYTRTHDPQISNQIDAAGLQHGDRRLTLSVFLELPYTLMSARTLVLGALSRHGF